MYQDLVEDPARHPWKEDVASKALAKWFSFCVTAPAELQHGFESLAQDTDVASITGFKSVIVGEGRGSSSQRPDEMNGDQRGHRERAESACKAQSF